MREKVLSVIERFSLIPAGSHVTVALSGGADSVALLHLLSDWKDRLDFTLSAAHYHHGIRGAEADRDEGFVREECERLGIPLFCERGDVPALAKQKNIGIELAAREARYAFLERVAPDLIATAHTASDNLETVLLNLTRGSGAKGLCGIPVRRGRVIRPMLTVTREEVEIYCRKQELSFVTDSTNLTEAYTRNKLRHTVVPVLKSLNPSVEQAVLRAGEVLSEDEAALSCLAEDYLSGHVKNGGLELEGFSDLPAALQKRVVRVFAAQMFPELSLDLKHTEETVRICLQKGRTSLPDDLYAVAGAGRLTFESAAPGPGYRVDTSVRKREAIESFIKVHSLLLNDAVDYDKIIGKAVVRTRKEGDRIRLAGNGCTKTLKKLYLEKRVPLAKRADLPVIADDEGVIWIYGMGVASRCAVSENTKRVFIIDAREVQNTKD